MKVIWTKHAIERQAEWQRKRSITSSEIEALVTNPNEIVPGVAGSLVAQSLRDEGLLRVAFVQLGEDRKILTLYWTTKVSKYWQGG